MVSTTSWGVSGTTLGLRCGSPGGRSVGEHGLDVERVTVHDTVVVVVGAGESALAVIGVLRHYSGGSVVGGGAVATLVGGRQGIFVARVEGWGHHSVAGNGAVVVDRVRVHQSVKCVEIRRSPVAG